MADPISPKFAATDGERFEQSISMLKAYYDAIESRLVQNVTAYLAAIGWVITSEAARKSLAEAAVLLLTIVVLVIVFVMYVANILHYVSRWREIRQTVVRLSYIEPQYYARYNLPWYTPYTYVLPVAALFILLILLIILAHFKPF